MGRNRNDFVFCEGNAHAHVVVIDTRDDTISKAVKSSKKACATERISSDRTMT